MTYDPGRSNFGIQQDVVAMLGIMSIPIAIMLLGLFIVIEVSRK